MSSIRTDSPGQLILQDIRKGETLLDVLRAHGYAIEAPCGGMGTCGKCRVRIYTEDGTQEEILACRTPASEGMVIGLLGSPNPEDMGSDFCIGTDSEDTAPSGNCPAASDPACTAAFAADNMPADHATLMAAVDLGTTTVAVSLYKLPEVNASVPVAIPSEDCAGLSGTPANPSGDCDTPGHASAEPLGSAPCDLEKPAAIFCGTITEWNCQAPYGADVISRCAYIMKHPEGLRQLSGLIRHQIMTMIGTLCGRCGLVSERVTDILISGNTIMQHILAGLDPVPITLAPFVPETLFESAVPFYFEEMGRARIHLTRCLSGYVGGDLTAGLIYTLSQTETGPVSETPAAAAEMDSRAKASDFVTDSDTASGAEESAGSAPSSRLLIDIGTNGEMILEHDGHFISCSTATGPAFEGAQISCGMRGLPGAVSHVRYQDGRFIYETIGNLPPAGICGSGLMDLIALLLDLEIIDETGLLLPPEEAPEAFAGYLGEDENENGIFYLTADRRVYLTARDVRQIQLAKAAVAAGIETLTKSAGLCYDDIDRIYIAGGFGEHLSMEAAIRIGLLPGAFAGRMTAIGNSSLKGTALLLKALADSSSEDADGLTEDPAPESLPRILGSLPAVTYIELSANAAFTEAYIDHMSFE